MGECRRSGSGGRGTSGGGGFSGHSPVTSSAAVKQHLGQSAGGVNAKVSQEQPDWIRTSRVFHDFYDMDLLVAHGSHSLACCLFSKTCWMQEEVKEIVIKEVLSIGEHDFPGNPRDWGRPIGKAGLMNRPQAQNYPSGTGHLELEVFFSCKSSLRPAPFGERMGLQFWKGCRYDEMGWVQIGYLHK